MSFIEKIRNSDSEVFDGVNEEEILAAEQQLGIKFPKTYREILAEFGSLEIGSEEIFGLGVEGYLNVVETTLEERKLAKGELDKYIVIQNLAIDGLLIVVDENDNVYEYANGNFKNLLSSTAEYIESQLL
ncbi:SMI1/KNR4 family protein [Psychrobacillus sp. NEAU-3TGS]|uniref:SMI1/KNR4 family protein n=1 Tax=Psychrobacillus sp. NEAU-3TGS TaxID=2995412 RepID=UPI002498775A|nr:SMI1/KNR4 family protein [Psychrobacillus sp. NEAU-3TGS]MDI2587623.1 SMI1/KNR4 family protein [Psychrobacillus sp. NEAU-3TGS]